MTHVLDASALLAYLRREAGFEQVGAVVEGACLSSVNWAEVLQKCVRYALPVAEIGTALGEVGLAIEPFTASQAERAAGLWPLTHPLGLSLADRACLALAQEKGLPVLTADRAWADLRVGVKILTLR